MLTVHHLGHSQSDRVVWLCEELEIPYELKKYDRAPMLAPEEYKKLHPIGAAPVIQDGDITLAETEACVEYIVNLHGDGRLFVKPGAANYADFLYWYHLTNGTFMPAMSRLMTLSFAGVEKDNPTYQRYDQKLRQILNFFDQRLASNKWLAGDEFTAADIMPVFAFTTFREYTQGDLSGFENILSFLQRVVERPAFKRYQQKGDPDIDFSKSIQGPPPPKHPAITGNPFAKK